MRFDRFAVEARGIVRIFDGPDGPVSALTGVDLTVGTGTMFAVRGRSGSGKTTLLNLIGALDTPTEGSITVLGQRVDELGLASSAQWRAQNLGFVFQAHALMPSMTAHENVELVLRIAGMRRKERMDRATECLEDVGLSDRMHHRPAELSGGQRQRVAVARAIAPGNQLIIADEPTAGLDSAAATEVLELLRAMVDTKDITVLMATHDPLSGDFVHAATHLERGVLVEDRL